MVVTGGYGLVVAAQEDSTGAIASIRRRYRRDGLQLATSAPDPDGDIPEDAMLDPAGQNLHKIRQIMYAKTPVNPEQSFSEMLPAKEINRPSWIEEDGQSFLFCFVFKEKHFKASVKKLQRWSVTGEEDAVVIEASHDTYGLTQVTAQLVMAKLREYVAHFPLPLHRMHDVLRRVFLHHSLASAGIPVRYTISQGIIDNKPCLLAELLTIDFTGSATEAPKVVTACAKVALPIHTEPKDVDVPDRAQFMKFIEQPFDLNAEVPQARQRKLFDIAEHVVSRVHLHRANEKQVLFTLSIISKDFGVPLLFRFGEEAPFAVASSFNLMILDVEAGTLQPTPEVRAIIPQLPELNIPRNTTLGNTILDCFYNCFRHTQDLWLAYADAANAADMLISNPSGPTIDTISKMFERK